MLRQQRDNFLPLKVIRDRLARAGNGVPEDEPTHAEEPEDEPTLAEEPEDEPTHAVRPEEVPHHTVRPADTTLGVDPTEARRGTPVAGGDHRSVELPEAARTPVAARVAAAPTATRLAEHLTNGSAEAASDPAVAIAGPTTGEGRGGPVATEAAPPGPPSSGLPAVDRPAPAGEAAGGGAGTGGAAASNGPARGDGGAAAYDGEPEGPTAHASAQPPVSAGQRVPAHAAHEPEAVGEPADGGPIDDTPDTAAREPTETAARGGDGARPAALPVEGEGAPPSHAGSLTLDELCAATGLPPTQIAALEGFGLVEPVTVAGATFYDEEAVTVTRLAADLAKYGIEPRHLRMYRTGVDRELGLVEQVVSPLLRQRNPAARQRAVEVAEELATLGERLRSALIRRELRKQLGR